MNAVEVNQALCHGQLEAPGVLPKLDEIRGQRFVFQMNFGLAALPETPGLLLIRGARQYGKSTWLQQQVHQTVSAYGPGTAFLLNGDEIRDERELAVRIRELLPLYDVRASVRRLFIDEITAVANWQRALKILADAGELGQVLVVTTGSKAADLRHGAELLPGRKGKLDRTVYLFTPITFGEFRRVCGTTLPPDRVLPAYILSGGSPVACAVLAEHGRLPEYVTGLIRDWVYGEFAASGRSRAMLLGVMECLYRFGGTPLGQSKLAREAGLANNTVAAGYLDLLTDLMCAAPAFGWDAARRRPNRRQPCKVHLTNMLAVVAWHPGHPRSVEDYLNLPPATQATLLEWQTAQELWRRAAVRGDEMPETLSYWRSAEHELDFVLGADTFVEVKRGQTSPFEFRWFPASFPQGRLTVISASRYETQCIRGVTMEEFLAGDGADC